MSMDLSLPRALEGVDHRRHRQLLLVSCAFRHHERPWQTNNERGCLSAESNTLSGVFIHYVISVVVIWHLRSTDCLHTHLLSLGLLCSPISLNESDTRYNTIRQNVRNLSAFCSLVLYLPDKLLLDDFRACDLQSTHDQRNVNEEHIQRASLV